MSEYGCSARILFATVGFTLAIIPVSIFFILPCYIYRKIVSYLAQLFKPQLGKLLCGRSSLAAIDDWYTAPKCTLLGVAVVEGDVDMDKLKKDVMKRMVLAKNVKGGLMYPELQQYFSPWMGYLFWKWEQDFKIENHVTVHEISETTEINEMDLIKLRIELIDKPYKLGVSPWEWVVVRNFCPTQPLMIDIDNNRSENGKSKKSVLILRIHHGVTDGYSLLNLFLNTLQSEELKLTDIPQPNFHRRNYLKTFMYHLWAVLCIPYYVTQQLLTTNDDNYFHPKGIALKRKGYAAGITLPVSLVREIRVKNSATFSAVVTSALTGGIRSYLLANGLPIPEKMHVTSPLPWPGHPSKLRNFWSFFILRLPLEVSDAKERLRIINEKREAITRSTVPLLNLILVPFLGALPTPVIQFATKRKATTIMMSNFPGPQEPSSMLGYPIIDVAFGGGFGRGNLGFGVAILSYNGTMKFGIKVDQALIPSQEKVQELLNFIKDEIHILGQDTFV